MAKSGVIIFNIDDRGRHDLLRVSVDRNGGELQHAYLAGLAHKHKGDSDSDIGCTLRSLREQYPNDIVIDLTNKEKE